MTDPGLHEEVARLRAERDQLLERLKAKEQWRHRLDRLRRTCIVALVVLASVAVPLATAAVCAKRTLVDRGEWVGTVAPLARDRSVQVALRDRISAQIMGAIDVEDLFTTVLPERGRFLAVPLEGAVEDFVRDKVDEVVSSETFARLWAEAAAQVHPGVVAVLRGEGAVLQTEDGRLVLNLVPVANAVLAVINRSSPEVLGRGVTLPTITSGELPEAARRRLERALDRPLPEDFGRIELSYVRKLTWAQRTFRLLERLTPLLVLLAVASVVGAIALTRSRRRTLLQLTLGIAVGLVVMRRLGLRSQADLLDLFSTSVGRAAAESVSDRVLSRFVEATRAMLVLSGAVAAAALATGPYRGAIAVRRAAAALGRDLAGGPRRSANAWVAERRQPLQVAVLVAGGAAVLAFPLTWPGIVAVVGLVGALQFWLSRQEVPTPTPEA